MQPNLLSKAQDADNIDSLIREPMPRQDAKAVHDWARETLGLSSRTLARLMLQMQRGQAFVPDLDLVKLCLEDQIETWRIKNFEHFSLDIYVHADKSAKPLNTKINSIGECFVGYQQYRFTPSVEAPSKRIFVRLGGKAIKIHHRGHWRPLSSYADALNSVPRQDSIEVQQEQQSRWYQCNKKTFNIFGLPAEIRELIYQFALPSSVQLYTWTDRKRLKRYQYNAGQGRTDLSILFVKNVKLHREASHMLDLHTQFLATHRRGLTRMLTSARLATNIRHLRLSLTHDEYFRSFGFRLNDTISYDNGDGHKIRGVREMRLSSLNIEIKAPSTITEESWWDDACQRTVVEWLFGAAWPWIRGHPFTFDGYIKTSQKIGYEAKGAAERKAYGQWARLMEACGNGRSSLQEYDEYVRMMKTDSDGGVGLYGRVEAECLESDEEESFKKRQNMSLPPICLCGTKCTAEDWTPDD